MTSRASMEALEYHHLHLASLIFKQPTSNLPDFEVEEIRNRSFRNERIEADGRLFIDCEFTENVQIVVSGRAPPRFVNCQIATGKGILIIWDGFALATLKTLAEVERVRPGTMEALLCKLGLVESDQIKAAPPG